MSDLYVEISDRDYMKGNPDGSITVVEYGDYECPFSRMGYRFAQLLLKNYEDNLCFVFRNFPIRKKHPHAQISAEAALCAGKQEKFWGMHDLLFGHNENLSEDLIFNFAEDLGLDMYTFRVDLTTNTFRQRVQNDFRGGVRSGVNDTPTFFINGERYTGKLGYKELKAAVDRFL